MFLPIPRKIRYGHEGKTYSVQPQLDVNKYDHIINKTADKFKLDPL